MAEFVRAQIFGTTFEITSRYSDLQPVGMGAFGLVWYVLALPPSVAWIAR
jgi:p38 MAP kinase